MANAIKITDADFEKEVLQSNITTLVDFWAEWCGPCRMVGPIIEELAGEYAGKAKICKVNVDESPNTASKYGIRSIPSLLIFKNGSVVDQIIGAQPKDNIKAKLDSNIAK
ncbi:MAG: thioredoxin [Candidatus Firestonebacteria bacterium]